MTDANLVGLLDRDPTAFREPLLALARVPGRAEVLDEIVVCVDEVGALVVVARAVGALSSAAVDAALSTASDFREHSYADLELLATAEDGLLAGRRGGLAAEHAARFGLTSELSRGRFNRAQRLVFVADEYPERVLSKLGRTSLLRADVDAYRGTQEREGSPDGEPLPSASATSDESAHTPVALELVWVSEQRWRFLVGAVGRTARGIKSAIAPDYDRPLPRAVLFARTRLRQAVSLVGRLGISETAIAHTVVLAMALVYVWAFATLTLRNHAVFGTGAFDLGIYDQALWLISRGKAAFSTIQGMSVFGDRASPILFVLAPLYRVWPDVRLLLVVQAVGLAAGALPIYWLARDTLKTRWVGLAVAFAYLMYPAMQWANREDFHPETLAVPFVLFAFYFMTKRRWIWFAVFAALTLLVKEDAAFLVLPLGIYAFFKYDKRVGAVTSAVSLIWFLVAVLGIIPHYNPSGQVQFLNNLSYLGASGRDILLGFFTKPGLVWSTVATKENLLYLAQLFVPVALLPLLSPPALALTLPPLLVNLTSSNPYYHSIEYHFVVLAVPFVFVALVYGLAKVSRNEYTRYVAAAVLVAVAIASNYQWSPSPIAADSQTHWQQGRLSDPAAYRALAMIPADASVSAFYAYVPHLTHREHIYVFPNPWQPENWATASSLPDPKSVDYVVVDTLFLLKKGTDLLSSLQTQGFHPVFSDGTVLVLKRG